MNIISQSVIDQLIQDTSLELLPVMLTSFIEELDRRRDGFEEAIKAFQSGDCVSLREAAHALKSCSGTFGAELLYEQAKELENAAKDEKSDEIPGFVRELRSAIENTHQAYSDYLASLE